MQVIYCKKTIFFQDSFLMRFISYKINISSIFEITSKNFKKIQKYSLNKM